MDNNLYGLVAELSHFIDAQGELFVTVNRQKSLQTRRGIKKKTDTFCGHVKSSRKARAKFNKTSQIKS